MFRLRSLLLVPLVLLIASRPATADSIFLMAFLNGGQEVPPNPSTATGAATLVFNDTQQPVLLYAVTIFGLDITGSQTPGTQDNLIAAHIHRAPFGVNGPVIFGFFGMPFNDNNPNDVVVTPFATGVGGTISGRWNVPEGNGTTLPAEVFNILSANTYFNFHTVAFPGGEIRGQIIPEQIIPEPATLMLVGIGMAGLGGRRWQRRFRTH